MSSYKKAREEIAKFIGIETKELSFILYKQKVDSLYNTFEIPKKSGGFRIINAPVEKLKKIQIKLRDSLYIIHNEYMETNNITELVSHGFQRNKSIITNAYIHKKKRYILNIDIANFFPSLNFGRVQGYFYKNKVFNFSKEAATIIAQLTCYEGKLPQGAPTSPFISNLIFNIVDMHIIKLANRYKLDYTRYADDMTFSTNNKRFIKDYKEFVKKITKILKKNGFAINEKKTRLEYFSLRQEVTGITVNDKLNASRNFIDQTRAMANQLYKSNSFKINEEDGTLNQLEGRFSFINQLDHFNNKIQDNSDSKKQKKKFIHGLNTREKQYQYFLFYKYFFNPIKPTIVTEGKTDIMHLKSALMKNHKDYPNLIRKNKDGTYEFLVYFLNKTKRLNYFLGISQDGADTMKNIWDFYTGNNCSNIYEYIENKSQTDIKEKVFPVILLFDNEQKSGNKQKSGNEQKSGNKQKSGKPLKVFLNHTGLKLEENQISKRLIANLFLQTIPLVKNLEECEIEDLYKDDVLNINIYGKKFNRDEDMDSKEYFGKYIFAKYILKNYRKIDFYNFQELLNSINEICKKTDE